MTLNVLPLLQRQPQVIQALIALVIFAVIAWVDFVLDRDLSLFALYLIPTLYAGWFLGSRWGYLGCFASALVWIIDDWGGPSPGHRSFVSYWNLAGRLSVLIVVMAVVNALRLDFGFFYRPARELGGDYYDFIPFNSERMGLAVGDVSGKGVSSALLMASLQSLVRTDLAIRQGEARRFAADLNQSLYELTASDRYATLFVGIVDISTLTLDYVNAGHNPPLLFRKGTSPTHSEDRLEEGGLPVGMLVGSQYHSGKIPLHTGDVLVAYTDGISDALDPQQKEFGEARLRDIVRSSLSLSAAEICKKVGHQLQAFVAENPQWDDMTLVVMKIKDE